MSDKKALLIIASSEADSNLYYASHFLVPDPVIYFEIRGKKHLVVSELEYDRAKMDAQVHHVILLSDVAKGIKQPKGSYTHPTYSLLVHSLFQDKGVREIIVPATFPALYYESLKKLGYTIHIKSEPFFEARLVKTQNEKKHILHSISCVEKALHEAVVFLQRSSIKRNKIYNGRELVTSELLRSRLNTRLMELGCVANSTIIASGTQGSLPHHEGSGPIIPHTPIIFDIFPRNAHSRYWADMTRTMVKGKPSDEVKKMFSAVRDANRAAREKVASGVHGKTIHQVAADLLIKRGFKTGFSNGRMEGFIHSTGHGLGLDVHEQPSISTRSVPLKSGFVITIEPGLYYKNLGGVRLEDDLYVTKNGSERLTQFPTFLEIDH